MRTLNIGFIAFASLAVSGQAALVIPTGTNPATGLAWGPGDTYHLVYVTTNTTDAQSTDISTYNAFVQADANGAGMGDASWFVVGSTATTDAKYNAVIVGPVINVFDGVVVGLDAADFWDLVFGSASPTTLAGTNANVHFGTLGGGTAALPNDVLGAEDGSVRIEWTGWTNWATAYRNESTSDLKPLVAVSEAITIIPEPGSLALLGLGGLLVFRRRRS